jgi:hypothetical protein
MKRRLGKVLVSKELLDSEPKFLEKYLSDFQVFMTKNKMNGDMGVIEYTGIHPEFEETEADINNAPEYSFVFIRNEDGSVKREIMK